MQLFRAVFLDFKLQRLAISMPVEVRKNYILFPAVTYFPCSFKLLLFGVLELAISKSINIEKSYIPQKKALNRAR